MSLGVLQPWPEWWHRGRLTLLLRIFQWSGLKSLQRTDRASDVTAPTARFPFEVSLVFASAWGIYLPATCKVTLHQGAIEAIFLDSMSSYGIEVDRPYAPAALEISDDSKELQDPNAYPIKVRVWVLRGGTIKRGNEFDLGLQVTLNRLDAENTTEIVHAKYVVGCDGTIAFLLQDPRLTESTQAPIHGSERL